MLTSSSSIGGLVKPHKIKLETQVSIPQGRSFKDFTKPNSVSAAPAVSSSDEGTPAEAEVEEIDTDENEPAPLPLPDTSPEESEVSHLCSLQDASFACPSGIS